MDKLRAARFRLSTDAPYFSAALWSLRFVPAPGLGTLGVDAGWRCYYDQAVVDRWTREQIQGVLAHEISHLLREHHARAKASGVTQETAELWNIAADAAINPDLAAYQLPEHPVMPENYGWLKNKTVEEYYTLALQQAQGRAQGQGQGQNQGQGQGQGRQKHPGQGNCGSCATGVPQPHELPSQAPGAESLSSLEAAAIRSEVAHAVREYNRTRGTLPAGLELWAREQLAPPKIAWQTVLRSAVRASLASVAGCYDYSYARPSRRQDCAPRIILPAMRSPVPEVAIVLDTSGSMDSLLALALAEVEGVLKQAGSRGAPVLCCDAEVASKKRLVSARGIDLRGGGGTDMGVGIAAAAALQPRPNLIVVITDGQTPWPSEPPPGIRVIVGTLDDDGPGWAKTIKIER